MGNKDFLTENVEATVNETAATPLDSLDEMTIEGNDVETGGLTMEEVEDLVSKVLSKSHNTSSNESEPSLRLGAPSSGSTPEKVLFKGFKQLLKSDFEDILEDSPESLLGYLSLVRDTALSATGKIYFGTRDYSFDEDMITRRVDCGEY